uniref:NADH-ubiquinone oxidoreductase chain 4 n=1 Tax=Mileewa amplimacula TaxID=2545674 RepID=A0A977TM30_9HEMI|nr:NADH dehydrogenase subunit 4 [Mileewa amplimacula]UXX17574.1 NADH dehydrogenase subunit 4 [Mileewa amplimacula]
MMMILFFYFFMIPLFFMVDCLFLIQYFIICLFIYLLTYDFMNYYCNISYFLGLDFVSYGLIILTLLIICLMFLSSMLYNKINLCYFIFVIWFLCLILIMIFSVMNMFILYMFFELSLIPLLILIYGWGYQPERLISGLYMFFYTLFASLPLLLVIIYLYKNHNTMIFCFIKSDLTSFVFNFCLFFAFLVKLPMFMVHFWLPKAHVQAPVSGSMILAGVLLKIGGYGLIRFMSLNELVFMKFNFIWYSISIFGSVLIGMICFIQSDLKCLIAYSSVVHMGMCLMGFLSMTKLGVYGSFLMMLGHGLCSSGLFCLANISYERLMSRSFFINKGMINYMPNMTLFWFIFCCFNMSCPPSINFLSEIMIMCSMISFWSFSYFFIIYISFIGACFSFFLFSYSQHGSYVNNYSYCMGNTREFLLMMIHLIPLFFIMLCMLSFY